MSYNYSIYLRGSMHGWNNRGAWIQSPLGVIFCYWIFLFCFLLILVIFQALSVVTKAAIAVTVLFILTFSWMFW